VQKGEQSALLFRRFQRKRRSSAGNPTQGNGGQRGSMHISLFSHRGDNQEGETIGESLVVAGRIDQVQTELYVEGTG